MSPEGAPRLWTLADAAVILRTTERAVYDRVRRGRLPAIRAGGRAWLIVADAVLAERAEAVARFHAVSPKSRAERLAALLPPRRGRGR